MYYRTKSYFLLFLFCFLTLITASAIPKVQIAAPPQWLAIRSPNFKKTPEAREINNGCYISLFDEQVNVETKTRYIHTIKEIINESGVQYNSELSYSFVADYQQVFFHKICIWRDGVALNKLDLSKIKIVNNESSLYSHQIEGIYNAILILDDLRKGDKIDISYSIKGNNPIYNNIYSDRFSFASYDPITNYYTSILIPSARQLNYKCYNGAKEPAITSSGNYTMYDWGNMSFASFDNSDNTPSWYIDFPCVEVSEFKSWKEVAQWASAVMNNYNYPLPDALNNRIKDWSALSKGADARFVELATRFVQDDIRYMGIEIGENSHKPHPPSETFAKRYGDCKDKSILLVSILRSQNIKAYAAVVSTSLREHIDEHIPSALWFNHVIVKAVVDKKTIWIDATNTLQRGYIENIQLPDYGNALIVDDNSTSLETIPLQYNGKTEIVETYVVKSTNAESATLDVVSTYAGGDAESTRSSFNNNSLKNIEQWHEDYYKKLLKYIKSKKSIEYADDPAHNIFTVQESYTVDSIWQGDSRLKQVEVYAKTIYERLPVIDEKTKAPLALPYPSDIRHTIMLKMPDEWPVKDDPIIIDNSAYRFTLTKTAKGDTVVLEYTFTTYKDHISIEELAGYKKDYKIMVDALGYALTYNKQLIDNLETVNKKGISVSTNWIAVFISLITLVAMFVFLYNTNKKDSPSTSHTCAPESFTWWMVLLCIVMGIRIIIYAVQFLNGGYLSTSSWIVMNELGATGLQLVFILEMIVYIALCVYAGWLLYWMIRRRDIFPKMFIAFALAECCMSVLFFVNSLIFKEVIENIIPGYTSTMLKSVTQSCIFVTLWVTTIVRSEKVKDVFIRPFRYNDLPTPPTSETNNMQQADTSINDAT